MKPGVFNVTFREFSQASAQKKGGQRNCFNPTATLAAIFTPNFQQFFIAIAKVFTNYFKLHAQASSSPGNWKNFACNLTNHCKGYTFHSFRMRGKKVPRKHPFSPSWLRKKGSFFGPGFLDRLFRLFPLFAFLNVQINVFKMCAIACCLFSLSFRLHTFRRSEFLFSSSSRFPAFFFFCLRHCCDMKIVLFAFRLFALFSGLIYEFPTISTCEDCQVKVPFL